MSQTNVEFAQYNVFGSVLLIQYAVVGGIAWVAGIVGATGAPTALGNVVFQRIVPSGTDIVSWLAVLSGLSAILVLRQAPDGIAALWSRGLRRAEELSSPLRRVAEGLRFPRAEAERPAAPPRARRPAAPLAVRDLVVTFGGVVAVDGVELPRSSPVRSSGSSARTGPARRPSSTSSPASPRRRADRSFSAMPASTAGRWSGGPAPASCGRGRPSRCSRR